MGKNNELNFQVLIEEDKAQGDFSAYIPALRLGVHGDSLEDVRENAKDLLLMEIESRVGMAKAFRPIATHVWKISAFPCRSLSNAYTVPPVNGAYFYLLLIATSLIRSDS